ncbi:ATP synthase F1 subunit epsilon [Candidatus Dojkabacteria bacterium]|nr:ATP synthase F1 subunit epsilon [Candidatus Dojkabacteria bacterium]
MKIRVISSQKILLKSDDVRSVSLPGSEGQMQILPSHENLVSTIEIGKLEVQIGQSEEKRSFVVNGGFVVVREDDVIVLVDDAAVPDEVVKEEIEKAIENAQDKLKTVTDPKELIQLEKQLRYEKFKRQQVS